MSSLCFVSICDYCALFMSERASPSDSSYPKFIFRARIIASKLTESSQPMTSTERESEEVLEVDPKVEEVMSTPSQGKQKGK